MKWEPLFIVLISVSCPLQNKVNNFCINSQKVRIILSCNNNTGFQKKKNHIPKTKICDSYVFLHAKIESDGRLLRFDRIFFKMHMKWSKSTILFFALQAKSSILTTLYAFWKKSDQIGANGHLIRFKHAKIHKNHLFWSWVCDFFFFFVNLSNIKIQIQDFMR